MKIAYIENIRLPTEKAHGIQIMKMCEAFALNGHEITLIVPDKHNIHSIDPFKYYSISNKFNIIKVWVPNTIFLGKIGYWIQTLYFSQVASFYIRKIKSDIVYSRDELILLNYILIFKNIVWEAHRGSWNVASKILSRFSRKIIVISNGLKDFYLDKNNKLSQKILVSPDAVDLEMFNIVMSKEECRDKLKLDKEKKIILYSGHLYEWKGAYLLAEASKYFDNNTIAVFVGGTQSDIIKYKEKYESDKCIFIGKKDYSDIPYYLKAADILVLPNTLKDNMGSKYTSPLKLFEYMASGTSILASDVPAIMEVLNENNSFIFKSDNVNDLNNKINYILNNLNSEIVNDRVIKAQNDVKQYSWDNRASNIINSIF